VCALNLVDDERREIACRVKSIKCIKCVLCCMDEACSHDVLA
jgi:hypothetical protein